MLVVILPLSVILISVTLIDICPLHDGGSDGSSIGTGDDTENWCACFM